MLDSGYDDPSQIEKAVKAGDHRKIIGDMWDEIGQLQYEFLKGRGLKSEHTLLDVGCGSLRGGVHFVSYLAPGNYYGIDINRSLLDAGYEKEIVPLGLADKLPRSNLAATPDFEATGFGRTFDYLLAVSVFTHINWNRIRQCLDRLVDVTHPGSLFFATAFELPEDARPTPVRPQPPMGLKTSGHHDPFHYRASDLQQAAKGLPWRVSKDDGWKHPRGQQMFLFTRV